MTTPVTSFIDDANDPRLAPYRRVRDPELARASGLFVAEGRLVVRRVIESGCYRVQSVLVNEAAFNALRIALDGLDAPVYVCRPEMMRAIIGYNIHRGCLALVERPLPRAPGSVIDSGHTIVALDDVANADNVGGVFRNAAAFGAAVLISACCCDPLYRKAVRTSMGAVLSVPWARIENWPADLFALRTQGYALVALTPREPTHTLEAFVARSDRRPLVLIAGAEMGLSAAVEAGADYRVRIPIAAAVDSLNLVVAVGIALSRLVATV
jgi:tRNA G18 (ribose-2'-O)-methylase SpoU